MKEVIEISNFLTSDECDRIINLALEIGLTQASTISKYDFNAQPIVDIKFNKRKICYIADANLQKVSDISEKILLKINELNYFNNIEYVDIWSYSFNKYSEGDFLNWHADGHEIANGATMTIVIELSDDFEGGEFCCKINNIEHRLKKGKGTMYVFASTIEHRVTEITNGSRYSFNAWPRMKKTKQLF